ncbi:histidine phosphatase motif-containing protein [Pandoravirus inopinatum]|uniref:Histidine phosphatase motif-containing protein n=1 Tax=Pandoravirus inopinatum TaxID=1605721 RepID=A0A0B5JES1_9VIRU|nr:histidine phosphatase motif-containing protein [Pandoravirus inopinatum]AJF98287.1 histidine phosphatase motif-containing protein [Pandoravirus inopinatum]
MRRVAERIGVAVPDDHVPFLGWFVARPRTSRPIMRGLSDHGLGRECPERALMVARSVGGARRRQRRRGHDHKDDGADGGRDRKRGRHDRAIKGDAKDRDRARSHKKMSPKTSRTASKARRPTAVTTAQKGRAFVCASKKRPSAAGAHRPQAPNWPVAHAPAF